MENYFEMNMTPEQVKAISSPGLAHMGDGVYEVLCRAYLCSRGNATVLNLHKKTVALVNAPTQARFMDKIMASLTEEEQDFYRRGKMPTPMRHPKPPPVRSTPRPPGWKPCLGHCICWAGKSGSTSFLT